MSNKADELAALIESVKADIVFGTESWLNPSISDSEVFPENFIVYRKDRLSRGGGVFLLVRSDLRSSVLDVSHDAVEAVWCKVHLSHYFSLTAGVVYRPPSSDVVPLHAFGEVISEVSGQVMLVGGDFNLPDLHWSDNTCVFQKCSQVNMNMKSIIDTHGLLQYVTEPTRENSILDLLFCNSPNLVNSTTVIPGLSDHHAVVASIKTKIHRVKHSGNRRVFFFDRGDYSSINEKLYSYLPVFECLADDKDVHELWRLFKNKLLELVEAHVPSADSSKMKKRRKPWMTSRLLRLINKRKRLFAKFKRTKRTSHYQKLFQITQEYKKGITNARGVYFKKLNDTLRANPKHFWQYIKSCGSESVGINEIVYNNKKLSQMMERRRIV